MKKFVVILSALMMMILAIVPMVSASADSRMYIDASNGGAVNVRTLPSKSGKVEVQLGIGFPVTVRDQTAHEGWSEVSVLVNGRMYYGYIANDFLRTNDVSANRQTFRAVKDPYAVTVRPSTANGQVHLWTEASRRSESVRVLDKGEELTVIAASHAWYKVVDFMGVEGYVAKAYVKK